MPVPEKFKEGLSSFTVKLNAIIDYLEEIDKRLADIEGMDVQTIVVHDAENVNLIRVRSRVTVVDNLGPIQCDCVSGESFGGPE